MYEKQTVDLTYRLVFEESGETASCRPNRRAGGDRLLALKWLISSNQPGTSCSNKTAYLALNKDIEGQLKKIIIDQNN